MGRLIAQPADYMQVIMKVRSDVAEKIADVNLAGETGKRPCVFEESIVKLVVIHPLAVEYKKFLQNFLNDGSRGNYNALVRFLLKLRQESIYGFFVVRK